MNLKTTTLSSIFFLLYAINTYSTSVYSQGNGNWGDASTWLRNSIPEVPTCGDTVYIQAGHNVRISNQEDLSNCGSPIYVEIDGRLLFNNGKKLSLPCNSIVIINMGADITPGSGGGNSNYIKICDIVEWNAGAGTLNGYDILPQSSLPIELADFSAVKKTEGVVYVEWTTATETNNDYFSLEKSTDGVSFFELAKVKGAGNSNEHKSYSVIDELTQTKRVYYRLKQVDFNGTYEYSDLITFSNENAKEKQCGVELYPNPNKGKFILKLKGDCYNNTSSDNRITVLDLSGKVVHSMPFQLDHIGKNSFYDLSAYQEISNGVYLIKVTIGDKEFLQKMVVN